MSNKTESVKVVVRVRPLNSKEKDAARFIITEVDPKLGLILVKNPDDLTEQPKSWAFDAVFDPR
jgi:hypothetical protein